MVQDRGEVEDGHGDPTPGRARDAAAARRDLAARARDDAGDERDRTGAARDAAADGHDRTGVTSDTETRVRSHESDSAGVEDALGRFALARREAASDRWRALRDREAGAADRTEAGHDRDAATGDREASSIERRDASTDHLTGVYDRRSGFAELDREMARARRLAQPLVVAFFDIDGRRSR